MHIGTVLLVNEYLSNQTRVGPHAYNMYKRGVFIEGASSIAGIAGIYSTQPAGQKVDCNPQNHLKDGTVYTVSGSPTCQRQREREDWRANQQAKVGMAQLAGIV